MTFRSVILSVFLTHAEYGECRRVITVAIYAMVYLGSALMLHNIYRYVRYARGVQRDENWQTERTVLYIPIALLVLFFIGYLVVGLLGNPDLVMSGILFGGSIFVFVMFVIMQRITERIQENKDLEAKLIAVEQSNRAKESILSSVSHEMRTPMNAIVGLTVIALKNPELPEETREQLVRIDASAQHLQCLINDMLDMGSMESGKLTLKEGPFSLCELVEQINAMITVQCNEKSLEYSSSVGEGVAGRYVGDADKLRRALLNILQNAVKFTHSPGAVSFAVELAAAGDELRTLRFLVSDTGIGIDEEFVPTMFDVFSQEDATTTNRYGGSGLGLAITKSIVDLLGGTIDVETQKGEGTTFAVTVDLKVCEEDEDEATAAHTPTAIPAAAASTDASELADLSGRRVLIVDDIDVNAEILEDLLDLEGVMCDRAENGQAALNTFAQSEAGTYDAILMDLRMPVMDGFEAARAIRALDRDDARCVPIVAVTANTSQEDQRRVLESGMDEHLSKPVDVDKMYHTLQVLIGRNERG